MMVNESMKKRLSIQGQTAPNPRMTLSAAFVLASVLSVPVYALLSLVDWLFL
jgi:hypothetical protein